QARAEPVTSASDIFSLGIVLYELAAGQHPFATDSEVGVLYALTAQAPVPPARLNPEIGAALAGLIEQMLAKDPRRRPTAAEVVAALDELARKPAGAAARSRRPTVGRSRELGALRAGFAAAVQGRGGMLCVTGEPGLGKTTLVEEFLAGLEAGGESCSLAPGRCSERLAGAEAHLPVLGAPGDPPRGG